MGDVILKLFRIVIATDLSGQSYAVIWKRDCLLKRERRDNSHVLSPVQGKL